MKSRESNELDKEKNTAVSRRKFLGALGAGGAAFLCPDIQKALAQEPPSSSRYEKHGWFYTSEEMRDMYEREYRGERILKNIIRKKEGKWVGYSRGEEFVVPVEFIEKTLFLFRQLIEQKTAKFLFRLDAFHGHFFVPMPTGEKYKKMHGMEEAREFLREENAGVLFHNSEHLRVDQDNTEEVQMYSQRNVIGWYDGRPLTILPLPRENKSTAADIPENSVGIGLDFLFAAHKDGQFEIVVGGNKIRLDISFNDETYF